MAYHQSPSRHDNLRRAPAGSKAPEGPKLIWQDTIAGYEIELWANREKPKGYQVHYGKQWSASDMTRDDAARELGYCIFHALQCDGRVD